MQSASLTGAFHNKDLTQGLSAEIIRRIDAIHLLLLKYGYPTKTYTAKSVQMLLSLGDEKKKDILQWLDIWHGILSSAEESVEEVNEPKLADKALKYLNFRLKDYDWLDRHQNEIIEIYTPIGIQLYRSMNFFETCGYSLLDLCVNEWFVLWERPKFVVDRMHQIVDEVLSGRKKDPAFGLGPHLVRETYNDGTTQPFLPRAAIVEFKNIYPAYGAAGNTIIGFVVTSVGKVISEGDEALKMGFI